MGVALYALLCLIWGSTWLVIKVGLGPLQRGVDPLLHRRHAVRAAGPAFPVHAGPAGCQEWSLVRHYQTTDDGQQLAPILMVHPDCELVDGPGNS